jgi:hypothetical protein
LSVDLSAAELGRRLDHILGAAERLIADVPAGRMDVAPPGREVVLRDLAFQLFRRSLAFADGMDLGRVRGEWLAETAPRDLDDGRAIARYGALVRARLAGWLEGAAAREYARIIDDVDGPRSGHDLLARTAGDAAERLRQLHAALEGLGLAPREPLPLTDLEGLGRPDQHQHC